MKAKARFKKVSLSTHRNSGHKSLRVAFGSCEGTSFCDFYFVRAPFTSKPTDAALAGLAWTRLVNQPVTRHFGFFSHASFGTSDDNDKEAWRGGSIGTSPRRLPRALPTINYYVSDFLAASSKDRGPSGRRSQGLAVPPAIGFGWWGPRTQQQAVPTAEAEQHVGGGGRVI